MDKDYIEKELFDTGYKIEVRDCVTSTNLLLKEKAKNGEEEFSVLIASKQTAGRGRKGRSFFSPDNTGLYMSIILRPQENVNFITITTDAAVACARAIEKISGERTQIKWVNDIYIKGKKVCGILAESSLDENKYIIVGIGVNVLEPKEGFPDTIKDTAASMFKESMPYIREETAVCILKEFMNVYIKGEKENILKEYRSRSIITGKDIYILKNGECEKGYAISIEDDYSLLVRKENGEIQKISSGDVSVRI